jgi:integrase
VIKKFTEFLEERKLDKAAIHEMNYHVARDYVDSMMLDEILSARTINNRITQTKAIFTELRKREYIIFNPFDRIEKMRVKEAEITAFTPKELEKIGELLPEWDYNLYVISQLIFYCFIRPAEIVRLQFKDVLWDHELIILSGQITKNKKSQVISMPDQLIKNIKDWDLSYPSEYYLFSTKLKPGTQEVAPTRIAGAWREFTTEKKLPAKNIYDLKHTGNGMAFDQGMNSRDIQLQNRHSSLEQTQQYLNKFRQVTSDKFKKEFKGY